MVIIKYEKIDEGAFISYSNIMRIWSRVLKIAGIPVELANDKNQSARIWSTSPTSIGIVSRCEYICIDTALTAGEVEYKLKNFLPSWIKVIRYFNSNSKSNVLSVNDYAKYAVSFEFYKSSKSRIREFFEDKTLEISTTKKGLDKVVDVKNRIYSYQIGNEELVVIAKIGDNALRIEKLVEMLLDYIDVPNNEFEIEKQEIYVCVKGDLVNLDQVLGV